MIEANLLHRISGLQCFYWILQLQLRLYLMAGGGAIKSGGKCQTRPRVG